MTRPTVSPIASAIMRMWSGATSPEVVKLALVVTSHSWRLVPLADSATLPPGDYVASVVPLPHGEPRRKTAKHVARNMLRTLRTAP